MNRSSGITPLRSLLILIVSIVLIEFFIMISFFYLNLGMVTETILDIGILTLVVFPILYFFSYRPLVNRIKDLEKAVDELIVSEDKYKLLVENLPLKIFLKDKDLNYITCNADYCSQLGTNSAEIVGKTDYNFFPRETAEVYNKQEREVIETGKALDLEQQYILKGKKYWFHVIRVPYKHRNGQIAGILGIFLDITERKNAVEELKKHSERLEKLSRLTIGRELKMIELKKELEKVQNNK